MSTQLSEELRHKLLLVARQSLEKFLKKGERIQFSTEIPELLEKRAVFVTLRKRRNGDLRGCIGQSKPRYPLIEAVANTAISSAFAYLTVVGTPACTIVYASGYLKTTDFLKVGWKMCIVSIIVIIRTRIS